MLVRLSMLKEQTTAGLVFWLQFALGSANTEPLAVDALNACGSSLLP